MERTPPEERATLTVPEAARTLGISTWSYYTGIKAGRLPSLRIGGRIVVPRIQLDAYLAGTWAKPA